MSNLFQQYFKQIRSLEIKQYLPIWTQQVKQNNDFEHLEILFDFFLYFFYFVVRLIYGPSPG
jgi:hypothetical protein